MNANMPVTNVEREIEDAAILVFKADLNGVITFADCNFIRISGFKEGDLYGKSHNMVRHPDMPQAVFMELQDTIASGRTWTGIIKNRCKNGEFYWAHATVSPVRRGRKIVGYTLAYRKPTQPQIGEACRLYQQINEGKETVLSLSSLADSPGAPSLLYRLSTSSRFIWALTCISLLLVCAGAGGLYEAAQQHHISMRNAFIGSIIAGLLVAAWAGFLLARALMRPHKKTIRPAAAFASNEPANNISLATEHEAGCLTKPRVDNHCNPVELAGNSSNAWHQAEKQPVESRKTSPSMKEQNLTVEQNTGNVRKVRRLARNSSDILIKSDRHAMGGTFQAADDAGKAVEGIVVAVKRVANIMAEISAVPAGQGAAGFHPDKSGKLAVGQKPMPPAECRVAKPRPLRAVKEEDDEWKGF